ncbi:MAG: hypothetical protein MRZ54_02725 [Clostridiales bacterium]|nr:hypothetical protein [Clostridiales bacterium]
MTTRETPEQLNASNNLNEFVTVVTSDWPSDGKLYQGVKYNLHMEFKEVIGHQFGSEAPYEFYYTFPKGVKPVGLVDGNKRRSITRTITLEDNTTREITVWMTYDLTEDQLKVTFNSDDATRDYLTLINDSSITLDAWIQYDETSAEEKIVFENGTSLEVKYPVQEAGLEVDKSYNGNSWEIQTSADGKEYLITYTVTVKSNGFNENVVVKDRLSLDGATGVHYLDGSLTAYKNGQADTSVNWTKDADGNGFQVSLGNMKHGEVYTLTYQVCIPRDAAHLGKPFPLEQDGKVSNKVAVSSTGKEDKTDEKELKIDKLPEYEGVKKAGATDKIEVIDGVEYQIVKWTVTVNKDGLHCMTGQQLTDTLTQDPPGMSYYGDGITVDGTPKLWSDASISGKTDTSFTYTFTDGEDKKEHTIIYYTKVPLDFPGQQTHKNTASIPEFGSAESGVQINGKGHSFTAQKHYEGLSTSGSQRTMKWKLTLEVPEKTKDVIISDTVPSANLDSGNNKYVWVVEQIVDGTVQFLSGNRPGEQIEFVPQTNPESNTEAITLHLVPTSALETPRTIEIVYETYLDPRWENYGGLTQDHKNSAEIKLKFEDDTESEPIKTEDTGTITSFHFKKAADTFTPPQGDELPKYPFHIELYGYTDSSVTIVDDFDTELFEIVDVKLLAGDAQWKTDAIVPVEGKVEADGKTIVFTDLPKKSNTWGDFEADIVYYQINYALKVKSKEALETLLKRADANNGSYSIANTATVIGPNRSDSAEHELKFQPITKEFVDHPSADNKYVATFRITVNPNGYMLNKVEGIDTLEVVDTMTNLRMEAGSLEVWYDGENHVKDVDYSVSEDTLRIIVPDGKKVEIRYRARVVGAATGSGDTVPIRNTASVAGYRDKDVSENVSMGSDAKFDGSQNSITVKKVSELNVKETLPGVEFELFQVTGEGENAKEEPRGTYVTGANGTFTIASTQEKPLYAYDEEIVGGSWSRISYYLKETKAPAGYEVDPSRKIWFKLFKNGKNIHEDIDYAFSGDTIIITNKPVGASISKVGEKGNPLKGVYLSVIDEDGYEVDTWVSSGTAKIFPLSNEQEKGKLVPDKIYTLKELNVPTGYTGLTADVAFMVDAEGNVTLQNRSYNYQNEPEAETDGSLLTVKNIPLPSIGFMKIDSLTMEGVAGAKLVLRRDGPDGEIVEKEWETTKEAHMLEGGLEAGAYCLVETAFPNGYDDTQENYVIFQVNEKGAITEVSPDDGRAVITDSGMTLRLKNKKLQADPTPSVKPSPSPSTSPSTKPSPSPSTSPSTKPSPSPSTSPSTKPSPSPSTSPSTKPSPSPSTSPSTKPSPSPSTSPSTKPSASPSTEPSPSPSASPSTTPYVNPVGEPGNDAYSHTVSYAGNDTCGQDGTRVHRNSRNKEVAGSGRLR